MDQRTNEQLTYLELLQRNIARLHEAATSMKRFAVVAFALGGSLARYLVEPGILYFTMVIIFAFWLMDSKYLQAERAFIDIFNVAKDHPVDAKASFNMTPGPMNVIPIREFLSWSTFLLYLPMLVLLFVVRFFFGWK